MGTECPVNFADEKWISRQTAGSVLLVDIGDQMTIEKKKKKRTWFSASFLKTYKTCPYRAMNEPFSDSPFLTYGNMVHDILAEFVTGRLPVAKRDELKDIFLPKVLEEMKSMKFGEKFQKTMNNFATLKDFQFTGYNVFDVESENCPDKFHQMLYGSRNLRVPMFEDGKGLRGKIDLILDTPEHLRIIDYKTGSTEYDEFQILCYGLMVCFAYDLNPDKIRITGEYWYLEKGKAKPFPITSAKLMDHHTELCHLKESYDSGIYVKKPSWDNCRMCQCDCEEGSRMQRFKK
jgi:hypothetical protein